MFLRMVLCLGLAGMAIGVALPQPSLAQTPAPSTPAPTPEAKPAAPAPTAPVPAPAPSTQPGDPFGEEIELPGKTIVFMKGTGSWDNAFETITNAFKTVKAFLDKQNIKADAPLMTIYTATDNVGFEFEAAIPVAEPPSNPPRNIVVGKSPDGKALKFIHRGSYEALDSTYEAITDYLDEKRLDAKDVLIEEYTTDPLTTPQDKLVVNVYVPIQ